MSPGVAGAFQRVRGQIFGRSPALEDALVAHGWEFTREDLADVVHRVKAWQGIRSRLEPSQVHEAIAREEPWALRYGEFVDVLRRIGRLERVPQRVDDVEDAIDYLWRLVSRLGRLPPLRYNPARSRPRPARWWKQDGLFAGYEETGLRLPEDLLGALMGILSDLVGEFLKQLEAVGKFELPPILPAPVRVEMRVAGRRDPGAGPPGELPVEFAVAEVGSSVGVVVSVGAGATATVLSPRLVGPRVLERILLVSDDSFAGQVQLVVVGAGVDVPTTAGFGDVLVDPLIQTATNVGTGGAQLPWQPFGLWAEFWPRRLVRSGAFKVGVTVSNPSAATRVLAAAIDGRDVRSRR